MRWFPMGEQRHAIKVDTTPHDYTVSFNGCLSEAAKRLGYPSTEAFLAKVGMIRWSSTITTNVLGERRGSKVGLLVTEGNEENLYGTVQSPVVGELVDERNIIGLPSNPTAVDILSGVKQLLEGGVRRICVCLANAFPDNGAEREIKAVIEDQYPDHIIGAVPVLLGSEMAPLRHDQTRVHYSLMNAYTHTQLATSLFKAEDLLRDDHNWTGPLLIGNTERRGRAHRQDQVRRYDRIRPGFRHLRRGLHGAAVWAEGCRVLRRRRDDDQGVDHSRRPADVPARRRTHGSAGAIVVRDAALGSRRRRFDRPRAGQERHPRPGEHGRRSRPCVLRPRRQRSDLD